MMFRNKTVFVVSAVMVLTGIWFLSLNKNTKIIPADNASITPTSIVKSTFKVYFGKKGNEEEGEECKSLSYVEREIAFSITAAKDAVEELLKGPTNEEISQGYYTNINKDTILNKISIEKGIVEVDFSKELSMGVAGSCKVTFIRSQVEETLKQFNGVKEVIITVNGQKEGILEP